MELDVSHFRKAKSNTDIKDVSAEVIARNSATPAETPHAVNGEILPPEPATVDLNILIPPPLRGIDLSQLTSKAALICALTHNLPRNDYNLPKILYRPDLLDPSVFYRSSAPAATTPPDYSRPPNEEPDQKFKLMQELLDNATIQLQYHEGYPAIEGIPLWAKFSWETEAEHGLFQEYLELPGARQLALLSADKRAQAGELFHTNYWALRCLANDTFAVVHYKRMRERRIMQSDDSLYLMSDKLFNQLKNLEPGINWEVLKEDPEKYVQTLERVAKIQRAALGISERRGDEQQVIPSVELIMRKTTEHLAPLSRNENAGGVDIQRLLADPKSAEQAQELILRIGSQR